jgi:hypothetical protein
MYEFTAHHGVRGAGGHRVRDEPLVGSTIEKRKEGIDKFGLDDRIEAVNPPYPAMGYDCPRPRLGS